MLKMVIMDEGVPVHVFLSYCVPDLQNNFIFIDFDFLSEEFDANCRGSMLIV